jgi:uncharacterized phage protein gp47/JayE
MAFQIKDFASIVAGCINWVKSATSKITDFNVGSVARTMIEAPAAEMDQLYQNLVIGLQEAIPVSVFTTFGFNQIPAEAASGIVRFSTGGPLATSTITVPAGSVVKVPGTSQSYATQATATINVGASYVDVLVAAQTPGVAGNTDSSTITEMSTPVSGVASVTNPNPFINGRDQETDDERKTRFQSYVSTLSRGTNSAIEYGAKSANLTDANGTITEYVAYAKVYEPYVSDNTQPVALVDVYIHNGASATSGQLVAAAQNVVNGYYDAAANAIPGWKAAGVNVVVSAANDKVINVTGTLTLDTGVDHDSTVGSAAAAVKAYIQGLDVGATVVLAELIAIIMRDIPGVYNVVLATPNADVTCAVNEKAIAGTVTLS